MTKNYGNNSAGKSEETSDFSSVCNKTTLDRLTDNEKGIILKINGTGAFKRRLIDMGFIKGVIIQRKKCAPLADPVEFIIKNYHISLRHEEAEKIEIEKIL